MMANPDSKEIGKEIEVEGILTLRLYIITVTRKAISLQIIQNQESQI